MALITFYPVTNLPFNSLCQIGEKAAFWLLKTQTKQASIKCHVQMPQ